MRPSFLLAVFAGAFGVEFSRGTLRTLLMRQPGRLRFLTGKFTALLLFAAVAVAVTEALSVAASALFAPGQGISTAAWFTGTRMSDMATDYGKVMLVVAGWALLGASLGVLVPSVPVALGIGVGWAGPVEQVLGEAWDRRPAGFPACCWRACSTRTRAGLAPPAHWRNSPPTGSWRPLARRRPTPPRHHVLTTRLVIRASLKR